MDNKYQSLHETPIRAAIDLYDAFKAMDGEDIFDKTKRSPYASTSIARIASNMTLVFPVLCSTNLHIDTDMMIMKALERKYTIMLQILFSAYQVTDVKSAQDFISRFHSNIKFSNKASVDDFIDLADTFAESGRMIADKTTLDKLSKDFRENCFFVLEDDIAPTSIGQKYLNENYKSRRNIVKEARDDPYPMTGHNAARFKRYIDNNGIEVTKDNIEDIYKDFIDVGYNGHESNNTPVSMSVADIPDDAITNEPPGAVGKSTNTISQDEIKEAEKFLDKYTKQMQDAIKKYGDIKSNNNKNNNNQNPPEKNKDELDKTAMMKNMTTYLSSQILDSDIKKCNELVPTTMVVNFKYVNPNSGRATALDNIVLGIKARMIPVDSKDIVDHLLTKLNDRNFVTQLVRATTREISFFKDFIFAVDNAKIEALANSKRGSANPMWKVLERRAIMSRLKRFVGIKGNNANAITALVVSQEEVDYVRKNYGKNFDSMKTITAILDAYNLIGFAIADESMETVKFIFDTGEDQFETLAFSALEREASDNSYKKIVNLLSKVG